MKRELRDVLRQLEDLERALREEMRVLTLGREIKELSSLLDRLDGEKREAEHQAMAQRAAASVSTGDGGAWLEGDAARRVACDAMLVPVVTADLDPGAVEQLIGLCVQYDRLRHQAPAGPAEHLAPADADAGDSTVTPAGSTTPPPGQTTAPPPRPHTGQARQAGQAGQAARAAQVLATLEHQILATVLQIVSGPGGVASFRYGGLNSKPISSRP